MNKEKLNTFIHLIDTAIKIAEERREVMQTPEFYHKGKEAEWFTEADIHLGREYMETKYPHIFHYNFLDKNIIGGLKILKGRSEKLEIEEELKRYPKKNRGRLGMTRGISECGHEMWGDSLYDYQIYDACGAVEDYYQDELD